MEVLARLLRKQPPTSEERDEVVKFLWLLDRVSERQRQSVVKRFLLIEKHHYLEWDEVMDAVREGVVKLERCWRSKR
jgi:hypothetical protein